jgi:hypothetical protein
MNTIYIRNPESSLAPAEWQETVMRALEAGDTVHVLTPGQEPPGMPDMRAAEVIVRGRFPEATSFSR